MKKTFTKKSSFALLKTNPLLTGNIKMVVDSKGDIFIETIDGSPELSRSKFKGIKLDKQNNWSTAIYDFFSSGNISESVLYSLQDNEDFYSIKTDFSKQYYTNYQSAAFPKISKLYNEQLSYFAPIWLEPKDIPEYFCIFKIPEPVSVSTKNTTNSFDANIEKQIYNTNYFENEPNSDYFFNTILSKAKLHKVFDLGPDTTLGSYLAKHINDSNFPESSLTVNWNKDEKSSVNGISLKKSGFTSESFDMFSEAFPIDRTIIEFDNLITKQFKNHGVIHPNIINLEFLFDDEESPEYSLNRYFGLYINTKDITKFKIDSKLFYEKKYDNLPQNKDINSDSDMEIFSDNNIVLTNKNGIKLFVDYSDEYKLKSSDIKGSNSIPYIKSTDGNIYDIKNDIDWLENEIIIKDTVVNSNDFKGFEKNSQGIIPCSKTFKAGRSSFEFTILNKISSLELRIRDTNESLPDFNINRVFIGDIGLPIGSFSSNKFSLQGTPNDITTAITDCINNYSNTDEDFNINAVKVAGRLIIYTRGTNEYWNNYKCLVFSTDINFKNNTYFPNSELISIVDFNNNRIQKSEPAFLDYDAIITNESSMYIGNYTITESNFIGGNNNEFNRIKVSKNYQEYFNTDLFLKTKNWFGKIISICAYLDEPIYRNGKIVAFNDVEKYISINCTGDVLLSNNTNCEIYKIAYNTVGLMSFYPVRQFDNDTFRSSYNKDGDGFIDKLKQNYISKVPEGIVSISNNIQNFKDTGFKKLGGLLNEQSGTISYIENEYDRLKENELPELALPSRVIPFINKWVYDDDGKDVRENGYRLNSNSAFSYDNFSPSIENKVPDFRFFTHEWYYLQKYPPYLTTQEKINTFSYFEDYLNKEDLYDVNTDKFTPYFTQYKVDDVYFPKREKYSIISAGGKDSFGETFFRGAKLKFKRRVENKTELNFNIKNIGTFPSNYFNGYKFSAVLTNNTAEPLRFSFIENKQFKCITFLIEANLSDYYLNFFKDENNNDELFLDRSCLYVLNDKYDEGVVENGILVNKFADIDLGGAIVPYTIINSIVTTNFYFDSNGNYVIQGSNNSINGSLPNFNKQILPNVNGSYNDIVVQLSDLTQIKIYGIISVTNTTITAKRFTYNIGSSEYPFTLEYNNLFPTDSLSSTKVPKYKQGGFNAYKSIIEDISFASIFDKVNTGSPDISYLTVNVDGTTTKNTFLVEFDKYAVNVKSDYIGTKPVISNGVKNSNFSPIGSKTTGLDNTYLTAMFRYNGNYNPKTSDVLLFNEDFTNKFNNEIRKKLEFTNTQFFSTYPEFGLYKQLYINKVNEQNPLTILDLNVNTALRPEFWKIGEITIDKLDFYVFRSCWDSNFHRRYVNKVKFESLPGYVEPKEVSTFFGSTLMNIANNLKLEKYSSSNIVSETINDDFDISLSRISNNTVTGRLNNIKKVIQEIKPKLLELFTKYVNHQYNFREIDNFDDDIERYVTENILPRYYTENIYCYYKFSPLGSNVNLIESNMSEQELILDGFIKLDNINFNKVSTNEFDIDFVYNKPTDKNVTLAFITKISIL